jgi:mRNA interferase RelE/StbE
MLKVAYSKPARKALRGMPSNEARRIIARIEAYAADPRGRSHDVIKMQGSDGYRMRVGRTWRVIFEQDGTTMTVFEIGPRGQVYDR